MLTPKAEMIVTPWRPTGESVRDGQGLEAIWHRSLETAGNLLCRLSSDVMSTVSVVLPLEGEPGEIEHLEALGRRVADERELACHTRRGSHSITVTFSNRV